MCHVITTNHKIRTGGLVTAIGKLEQNLTALPDGGGAPMTAGCCSAKFIFYFPTENESNMESNNINI